MSALLAFLLTLLVVGGPAPASAQSSGLQVSGEVTYRLEPADGAVHVTANLHLVNTMPTRTRGAFIETPYFGAFTIPALGPVADASARSSDRELPVTVHAASDGVEEVEVDLVPNLVHGSPQDITVSFDLPGQPTRSESVTRVNDAFAAWVLVAPDPGIDVVVDVPEAFEVSFSRNASAAISQRDERRLYRLPGGDPDEPAVFATARNDGGFDTREVTVDDRDITIEAWPDDPEWAEFATYTVERGLPALREALGLELPDRSLTVIESTGAYHLGYAGVYVGELGLVEVGDELDRQVMLHELAHVWLNADLFTDRWIYEGLAEEVSWLAAEELGEERVMPDPIDPEDPAAVALNDWDDPSVLDPDRHDTETYAYNAAYAVVHELVEEIGPETFREVIDAAHDHDLAYARNGSGSERTQLTDWRYLYDLLELVGGSERARSLFVDHVLNEEQRATLDQRDAALEDLRSLEDAAGGWDAPLAVREEMSRWRFEAAHRLIDRSRAMTGRIDELAVRVGAIGIDPRPAIRDVYQTADDLDGLDATLGRFEQLGRDLLAVHERRDEANPVQALGLVGTGDTVTAAQDAYRSGQLDRTAELVARATDATARSTLRGIALLTAAVLLAAAVTAHVRIRRR